jgi:hypothetical protein
MGGSIPREIKQQVLILWLQGKTRAKIAKTACIGEGSVTAIVSEARDKYREYYDVDLLRGVAVMLRKESGDLGDLAFSIRLRKIMDENSLSEDNMESAIIKLAVYCYRNGISQERFLIAIHQVITLSDHQNLRIDKIPEYIRSGITTIESLEIQRQEVIQKKQALVDPLDELNQVMEAPYENLINQIRELKMKLREKDNYLKHAKEELQEWRKKYHILLMDCPEGVQ